MAVGLTGELLLAATAPAQSNGAGAFALQVLRGIYLGLLTGLVPAVVGWAMGFLFKYVTGISIPAFGVVVLSVALAGVNGGLLAVIDPAIQNSANAPTLVTALLVVMMLALYGHGKGDALGATLPRRVTLRSLRSTRLSDDVIEFVGGREQVTVTVTGQVADLPGYPPLPEPLRAEIAAAEIELPAGRPLADLADRVKSWLIAEYDLADAAVTLDRRGRASVRAASPVASVSRRVPSGRRGVSVDTLLPTGVAPRDEVRVATPDETVVSAGTHPTDDEGSVQAGGFAVGTGETTTGGAVTTGGRGRLTVATDTAAVDRLLRADSVRTVVCARGEGREYELIAALRRGGGRVVRATVADGGRLADRTVGSVETTDGVTVAAVRRDGEWTFDVDREATLVVGTELFVIGDRVGLERLEGAA